MTDHQHAADAVPDENASSGTDADTATAGEKPRAREQAGAGERTSVAEEAVMAGLTGRAEEPTPGSGAGKNTDAETPSEAEESEGAEASGTPHGFRRDRQYKTLAGVCSGLGRHFDMDPVIFRITLAVLAATGGIGLIFYGFAWLLVPYEDEEENEVRKLLTGRVDGQALAAVLFALVGCGVFLSMLNNGSVLAFAVVLSFLLAGAGYWSQRRGASDPDPLAAQAVADAPPEAQAPPVPTAYPSWWRDPIVKDGTHVGGTGYLWGPRDSRERDIAAAVNISLGAHGSSHADIRSPGARQPRPRGPRWIGGWMFLLALLAAGLGTGLTWQDQPLGTSLQTGLAGALLVFGVGIAVSAVLGRTGAGSVFLAIITAALLAGATALPKDIGTHWIRTTWRPAAVANVKQKYDLGNGVGTLDLSRLDLAKGRTVSTDASVGVGRLRVILPPDVTVKLNIDVGVGDIQLPGDEAKDVDVEPGKHKQVTLPPISGGTNAGTLDLDLQVGVGQAEVTRAAS